MLYVKGVTDFEPHTRLEDPRILRAIIEKCGYKMRIVASPMDVEKEETSHDIGPRPPPPIENLKSRPPVVTVMGHVDHGR